MKTSKVVLLVVLVQLLVPSLARGDEPTTRQIEFFESKIRPVLAENCYSCHNSVGKKKGGVALDYRAALLSSDVIVPGSPEKSRLIHAIRHSDGVEPMPSKAPRLAKLIVKNFEDWVRMGAPDPRIEKPSKQDIQREVDWDSVRDRRAEWWSFQPIRDPAPPKVDDPEWSRSSVDRFLLARMRSAGLEPRRRARPAIVLRRLYLTLVGTPPPPEIVDAYVARPTRAAFESLVDELLASKAFGERWGRFWLDWFRFAESHGSEGDPSLPYASMYRDYVIRALNADVPYDQLVREAVAGDLLDAPRVNTELGLNESAIGPAHLRMVPHGFGVTDAYDEQITFTDNQVDVISKALLGVTLSCARCHNHKFDPLSQKDFYKFYGMLITSRPAMVNVDSPELQRKNRDRLGALKPRIRKALAAHWATQTDAAIDAIDRSASTDGLAKAARGRETHPLHAWFSLSDAKPERITSEWRSLRERHESRVRSNRERIERATFYADLRQQSQYDRWFRNGLGLSARVSPAGSFAIRPQGDSALVGIYPSGVYTHLITDKDNATLGSIFHEASGTRTAVRAIGENASARFTARSYPLSHGGLHPTPNVPRELSWMQLRKYKYWNGEKVFYQLTTGADKTVGARRARGWFGVTEVYAGSESLEDIGSPAVLLRGDPESVRDRASLLAFYRSALREAIGAWSRGESSDADAALLEALRRSGLLSDRLEDLPSALRQSIDEYRRLESEIRLPERAPGVVEGEPWEQPLLVRGSYKSEAEPVPRGFLEVFGGRRYSKSSSGRLELAEDLLSEKNTLTARVIANRIWHHTFGRGLVASTDNLGRLGSPPSHPDLLDHLASELRRDGWSLKRMIRRLVTSRAFLSGSLAPGSTLERDPSNALLSFFPPRRLDAEAIFDSIHSVAGIAEQRAVYKRAQRNRLDPFLATFNLPIPTSTVGVRDQTNVPAQSLLLLNGDVVRRAAESWAQRLRGDRDLATEADRIDRLFREAYSRPPSKEELDACLAFLADEPEDGRLRELERATQGAGEGLARLLSERDSLLEPAREKLEAERARREAEAEARGEKRQIDLHPIAHWDFDGDLRDRIGSLHGTAHGRARVRNGALELAGGFVRTAPLPRDLGPKSLEVLVQIPNANQRGGGAMTVQDLRGSVFDSIVFAENEPRRWLAGSDHHSRTEDFAAPSDDEVTKRPVRIVLTWSEDGTIRAYRDGRPYGRAVRKQGLARFRSGRSEVLFGLRHGAGDSASGGRLLRGRILEARLYDRALSAAEASAASTGELREQITDERVRRALDRSTRARVLELDTAIAKSRSERDRLARSRDAERDARSRTPTGLARITHAILNSKELIYVH